MKKILFLVLIFTYNMGQTTVLPETYTIKKEYDKVFFFKNTSQHTAIMFIDKRLKRNSSMLSDDFSVDNLFAFEDEVDIVHLNNGDMLIYFTKCMNPNTKEIKKLKERIKLLEEQLKGYKEIK